MCEMSGLRRALICGVSGQDGAYLAQLLVNKGYEVWGTSRNAQSGRFFGLQELGIREQINVVSMVLSHFDSVLQVVSDIRPHEIYNLAGQSSVRRSFDEPRETTNSIVIGTLNLLEAVRVIDPSIRFFNAGSSECFGETGGLPADENTPFRPCNPYAVAKAAATWGVAMYRRVYGIHAVTGILFSHESPMRSGQFVTKKVASTVTRIANGEDIKMSLGNIEIRRDWGWAPEYVEAMWLMTNMGVPEDLVIATGESISLEEFVDAAFSEAGLCWKGYVYFDSKMTRPLDIVFSGGDPSKANQKLSWKASLAGGDVARAMVRAEMKRSKR